MEDKILNIDTQSHSKSVDHQFGINAMNADLNVPQAPDRLPSN
jgi:hypothetical protein